MRAFINNIKTSNPTFGLTGRGRTALTYTISVNTLSAYLEPKGMPGYVAGKTDINIVVNSGIYVWSNLAATPAMTLGAINSGDTVTLTNNGYIMGLGGSGGSSAGSVAISLGSATTIDNTNASAYIGGGGGGGGTGGYDGYSSGGGGGGGGGAGGGRGADGITGAGGIGGAVGVAGAGGGGYSGGGGGRIFSGTGGVANNGGGGSGGAGGAGRYAAGGGNGGTANAAGSNGGAGGGGGGGGWGATGGIGGANGAGGAAAGGVGGKAVALNAFAVTWVSGNTTRVYGAVS